MTDNCLCDGEHHFITHPGFQANKWCTRGVDLLANQPIERYQQMGEADQAMEDIEAFLSTASELKLNNPKEFRALFQSMITVETKV